MAELSGAIWVERFPGSVSVADLEPVFREKVTRFFSALERAQAAVEITATYRPPERAFLMHYAWEIARLQFDPRQVPVREGIDIDWVHRTSSGQPSLTASRQAAEAMVQGYDIVHMPALDSQHSHRLAVDVDISWSGTLHIVTAQGAESAIHSSPRTGMNDDLIKVGATYGVIKLRSDRPHWSADGH